MKVNKKSSQDRQIRVFISSTFRDMQDERDELALFVFPELRRRCRDRYLEFDSVDLRWGITEEQSKRGDVIPICLAMIERCHPFFICILGERYGWVPDDMEDTLHKKQSGLKKHQGKSATELEIIHGVMDKPEKKVQSFFYFRDVNSSLLTEQLLAKEKNYSPEPETSISKLGFLKERIRSNGYHLREGYQDKKALGRWVLEDLWTAIDLKFPKYTVPSLIERRRLDHEVFAETRRTVFITRKKYFKSINAHCKSDQLPLVITGESGSGKSALLANWAARYQQENPNTFILCHYIGSVADSADHIAMLTRIIEEIRQRIETASRERIANAESTTSHAIESKESNTFYNDPKNVVAEFPNWLAKAASKGKFILIIDALNQLEDKNSALDLGWLPLFIPKNVRLILSTLPGRSMDALKKRDYPILEIQPLEKREQREYIETYLGRYGKKLTRVQIEQITNNKQASNALFLRIFLEELKLFGEHEKLNDRIQHYLQAQTVDELFSLMLERLEETYEENRKGLVCDSLTLLWTARMGLTHHEILELLGSSGKPMPLAYWAPLFLSLEEFLINREGLLSFFHDAMKKAIATRYLNSETAHKNAQILITDYFEQKAHDHRKFEELPWQLQQMSEWERLKNCLTSIEMFFEFTDSDNFKNELLEYWRPLGEKYDIALVYNQMLETFEKTSPNDEQLSKMITLVGQFLYQYGRRTEADMLFHKAVEILEHTYGPNDQRTLENMANLALLPIYNHDFVAAIQIQRKISSATKQLLGPENKQTLASFENLAGSLCLDGHDQEGLEMARDIYNIYERVYGPNDFQTITSMTNLAILLRNNKHHSEAEILCQRAIGLIERFYGRDHTLALTNTETLALLSMDKGDFAKAKEMFRNILQIKEKLFGVEHPVSLRVRDELAFLLDQIGEFENASELYWRSIDALVKIYGETYPEVLTRVGNMGAREYRKGDVENAEKYYQYSISGFTKVLGPDHPDTLFVMINLVIMWSRTFELKKAMLGRIQLEKSLERSFDSNNLTFLSVAHMLAFNLEENGHHEKAKQWYSRALEGRKKLLGLTHLDTLSTMSNLAYVLGAQEDHNGAKILYLQVLSGRKSTLGDENEKTLQTMLNLAHCLMKKGEISAAKPIYIQAIDISRRVYGPNHSLTKEAEEAFKVGLKMVADIELQGDRLKQRWDTVDFKFALELIEFSEKLRKAGREEDALIFGNHSIEIAEKAFHNAAQLASFDLDKFITFLETALKSKVRLHRSFSILVQSISAKPETKPEPLRRLALECYRCGDLFNSEKLFQEVLVRGYEVPSTYCHLIRILLLANREEEAHISLNQALAHIDDAKDYVICRLLWFQILFAILESSSLNSYITKIKIALQNEMSCSEWTMKPLLDQIKPKITESQHAFLSALIDGLSAKENLEKMNDFPEWKESEPKEID